MPCRISLLPTLACRFLMSRNILFGYSLGVETRNSKIETRESLVVIRHGVDDGVIFAHERAGLDVHFPGRHGDLRHHVKISLTPSLKAAKLRLQSLHPLAYF